MKNEMWLLETWIPPNLARDGRGFWKEIDSSRRATFKDGMAHFSKMKMLIEPVRLVKITVEVILIHGKET